MLHFVGLSFFPHFLGLEGGVALGTSLFVLFNFALEPLFDALLVEEVPADWDSPQVLVLSELIHAHDAFCCFELIGFFGELDLFHLGHEGLDVGFLLLSNLLLDLFIVSMHLLDLSLEPPYVVDPQDVIVPLRVGVLNVEVDRIDLPVNVAPYALGHDAEH